MPDSVTSTTCSTPTNDSVQKVIKNDTIRYKKKGYGLITATCIAVFFFFVIPEIFRPFWTWMYKNNPDIGKLFTFLVANLFHTALYAVGNLTMLAVYKLKAPFFERYKITTKPWPWEADAKKWRETAKKTLKCLALMHFVYGPIVQAVDLWVLDGIHMRLDAESFPTSLEIIKQILFFMFVEDFMFYWMHRLLHHPKVYQIVHKRHHEYIDPVSISAEYAHPLESIFGNVIPMAMGMKLLGNRVHFFTFLMWTVVRIFETIDGHSGYDFSWSPYRLLPLSGSAKYHDFHHTANIGNYGSFFTLWDTLMATNKVYYRHLAQKEKEEELARQRQLLLNRKGVEPPSVPTPITKSAKND